MAIWRFVFLSLLGNPIPIPTLSKCCFAALDSKFIPLEEVVHRSKPRLRMLSSQWLSTAAESNPLKTPSSEGTSLPNALTKWIRDENGRRRVLLLLLFVLPIRQVGNVPHKDHPGSDLQGQILHHKSGNHSGHKEVVCINACQRNQRLDRAMLLEVLYQTWTPTETVQRW